MRDRLSGSMITAAVAAATVGAVFSVSITGTSAQAPALSATAVPAPKTPWGEPDLQGIWTDEFDTPLQRSAKYADQEFFTAAQRTELDEVRSAILGRFSTEREINGAYNAATFFSTKHTGPRTSKIVDPPNGRIPPLTAEAQKAAAADRDFRLALLQATDTCKKMCRAAPAGNTIRRPRRDLRTLLPATTPRTSIAMTVRRTALGNRCLTLGLPEFGGATGSFRQIVQTPAASRSSTTWVRAKGGSATSSWTGAPTCRAMSPVVRRFARPLGGQYPRHRRDELQSENRLSGLARELAPGRALDAHEADFARIRGHDRRPDGVDAAMDRKAGVQQAERPGEQDLLRAALPRRRREGCPPRVVARTPPGRCSPLRRDEVPIPQPRTARGSYRAEVPQDSFAVTQWSAVA
jgi:hypothetical protein